jgi:ATP-GRASP peptide maturase of grasp-with-spasm system
LWALQKKYKRINSEEFVRFSRYVSNSENSLIIDGVDTSLEYDRLWYRRGHFLLAYNPLPRLDLNEATKHMRAHLVDELKVSQNSLNHFLEQLDCDLITSKRATDLSKIEVLELAAQIGIAIPETIITNSKRDLECFLEINKKCIIKSLYNNFVYTGENKKYVQFNKIVENDFIAASLDEYVFPTLVQCYIAKKFEVRSFFYKEKIYSMAIFSQKDPKTEVDFRNYDYDNFNRCVPFKLPQNLEGQVRNLMDMLSLKTGSIDFIYSNDAKFYFLEVNPIGQFGMVSFPCNYYLERKIAEDL